MEELIEKIEQLKVSLDNTDTIKEIKTLTRSLDPELLEDIEEYKRTGREDLKEKIINNPIFREYKKKETDLNLMILEVNKRLKELTGNERKCK